MVFQNRLNPLITNTDEKYSTVTPLHPCPHTQQIKPQNHTL